MAAGDLTIVANVENFAEVPSDSGGPVDSFVARLITSSSKFIADWLYRDLLTLGGAGMTACTATGTDAGGHFITVSPALPAAPLVGAPVVDFSAGLLTQIVATPVAPSSNTTTKIYLVSASGISVNDLLNVSTLVTRNETYNGLGGNAMELREWPVQPSNFLSLNVGGAAITVSPGPGTYGWSIDDPTDLVPQMLYYVGGYFPRFARAVQTSYMAGYPTVLPDLEYACIELCTLRIKERGHFGQSSKGQGPDHIGFVTADMTNSTKSALKRIKRTTQRWS